MNRRSIHRGGAWGVIVAWAMSTANADPVTALAFRPDGGALVSGRPRALEFRDPDDGRVLSTTGLAFEKVSAMCFAPSGKWLVAAGGTPGEAGRWTVVDGHSGTVRATVSCGDDQALTVAVDAEGARVVVGGMDRLARIWRVDGEGRVAGAVEERGALTLQGHTGPVLGVAFAGGGRQVLTASADRSVGLWSAADGRRLRTLSMHMDAVHAVVVRPGESASGERWECASAGGDRTVRVWWPAVGRMVRIIRGHPGPVLALGYAPDGSQLFTLGRDGMLRCFPSGSDERVWERRVSDDWGFAVAVHPQGGAVATADAQGRVVVTRLGADGQPR